ncbi:hypothetical protein [Acanthopleuribacter pedis]|uniref:Uncharacterized protein n=1 Tax=Acanthopleuribacter pedis TaxID=442870 RepID=A0A8J7QIC4_9BACT|nr:hypothetical protein [Acanthopleuribacter pedis]MBO1318803.1 hypothetical protein [Acanthopleuribacter pedis]
MEDIFPFIFLISVAGMFFAYKTTKLVLETKYGPIERGDKSVDLPKKQRGKSSKLEDGDQFDRLQQRSAQLNQRLQNLEEILKAERKQGN